MSGHWQCHEQLGQIHVSKENLNALNLTRSNSKLSRANETAAEAVAAFNLGHAYKNLPALRNLDEAERWYRRSLELRAEGDRKGRAITVGQLGFTAREHFTDAKKEDKAEEELLKHLNAALDYYQQALALLPSDAVNDLAVTHNQLGNIYSDAGDLEREPYHYMQSVNYKEKAGNLYAAGQNSLQYCHCPSQQRTPLRRAALRPRRPAQFRVIRGAGEGYGR
ncbi:MAG: tetratricopeptide repeat protein [Anaerolineales bacterium]|nr:tetratricopeptide repeat protein [Anaerolineales bacterium]